MVVVDIRPQSTDIIGYGGDTLPFTVTAPASVVTGMVWNGQIRQAKDASTVDATFVITPPTVADGPANVVLTAADSARLIDMAPVVAKARQRDGTVLAIKRYAGVWDIQVTAPGGLDPVRTLVQGTIVLDMDVTRLP